MSGIVYTPQPDHECKPGLIADVFTTYPKGTVYECDCGTTWVCQGMVKPYTPTGHVSASLEWKREGKRARRKRERHGLTPEQVFGGYSGGKPARQVGPPPPVPSAATSRLTVDELASVRGKFEQAQRDGHITMFPDVINVPYGTVTFSFPVTAEQADRVRDVFTGTPTSTPPSFEALKHEMAAEDQHKLTERLAAAERCVLALTEALTGEAHDGVFDYDQAREHLLALIHARRTPSALPRIGETVSHAGWVGTVKRVTFDASMDAATLVATSDPIIDAGHVVAVRPSRGVTVTDRHGHEWVRIADAWMSQHDGSARDWPYLIEQCGPLRTKWSEPAWSARQPADAFTGEPA